MLKAAAPSRRLTSPTFSPAAAQRIADAAALQGRTVGNLIAYAALLYADQVLTLEHSRNATNSEH